MEELREQYHYERAELLNKHHAEKNRLTEGFAIRYAQQHEIVNISGLQRCFAIGYNQARCLVDWLEGNGYITGHDFKGQRRSLVFGRSI